MASGVLLALATVAATVPSHAAKWPDWLRTGKLLNMGLNYSSLAPERLDAFVRMRCRLFLGGASYVAGWGLPGEGALKAYHDRGLQAIAYSTPHTIYGDRYFEGRDEREVIPRSRDWLAVDKDGNPLRPWGTEGERYLACVNNPGWREHCRGAIAVIVKTGAVGIFWDDAFPFGCYCPHCRRGMRAHLAGRYSAEELATMGVTETELPPPPAGNLYDMRACKTRLDREWVVFAENSLEEFLLELKRAARELNPDFLFAVNSSQPGVTSCIQLSQNVMDLWVYEEGPGSLAPQHNNTLRYFQGFARAAKKPVEMIACGTGWGQEDATPVQYAASIAEGVACGGEFLVHLGHAGHADEVWRTNPANAETIAHYRAFFDQRQALLEGLQPAARVAIFDSTKSAWYDPEYYPRLADLARLLNYSGIPYTVVNAEATPDLLDHFDAAVVSFARVLSDREVGALVRFRESGKRLVCIGPIGTLTERWEERPAPLGAPDFAELPEVGVPESLASAAARGPRLLSPSNTRVQLRPWEKDASDGRVLVCHVSNYTLEPENPGALTPVAGLKLLLPGHACPRRITWESPEEGEVQELQAEAAAEGLEVTLPRLEVYGLVTITS